MPSFKSLSTGFPSCSDDAVKSSKIVDQLKRETRIAAIFGERFAGSHIVIAEHRAQTRAAAEEARRLAIREVDRFRFGQIDAAKTSELQQFAFDHVLRQLNQNIENGKIPLAQRHFERLHVQPVAREHAHVIAPARIRRGTAAARVRAIDHVIVNQRGAVNHLDDRAQPNRALAAIAARARREQQQRRTQPLAAAFAQVAADFRDRLESLRPFCAAISCSTSARSSRTRSKILANSLDSDGALRRLRMSGTLHPVCKMPVLPSRKNRRKFAAVTCATSSGAKFLTFAKVCATSTTKAGSLRFPRMRCGDRNGESVSVRMWSSGSAAAYRANAPSSDR